MERTLLVILMGWLLLFTLMDSKAEDEEWTDAEVTAIQSLVHQRCWASYWEGNSSELVKAIDGALKELGLEAECGDYHGA